MGKIFSSSISPAMSLLKLPLIVLGTIGCEIAYTSPNPPPKEADRASFVGHEDTYTKISRCMTMLARVRRSLVFHTMVLLTCTTQTITLLLALCEISTILIAQLSSSTLFNHILSIPLGARPAITTTYLIGWTFIVFGASLRLECYRTLGRHFTFELSLRKDQALITHGPYSIVRHPSYIGTMSVTTGMVLCQLGSGSWLSQCGAFNYTVGIVAALVWALILKSVDVMLLARISKEDAVLRKEFGVQWDSWAKKTPYKLIPFVY